MSESRNDRVGQKISNYRLIRLVGHGGFADVYLGEHIYLKTVAAVKILHTRTDAADRSDILNEARTIAQLEHPHIIRLFEYGVEDGYPFLIMSYAARGSLRNYYPRGSRLPATLVMSYVQQIASALDYAHKNKLIHRDVKPENMLIGQNGQLLLTDFGLVMMVQTSRSQATDDLAGTVAYMAPEQLRGRPRFASDQYALGVVVYEWLCGKRPFNGSFAEIASQHMLEAPPSLLAMEPRLAPEVEQVVFRALAKDSVDRFESVGDFAHALCQAYSDTSAFTLKMGSPAITPVHNQSLTPQPASVSSNSDGSINPIGSISSISSISSIATLPSSTRDPGETVEIPIEEAITSIYDTGTPTNTARDGLLSSSGETATPGTGLRTLRLLPSIATNRAMPGAHNRSMRDMLFVIVLLLIIGGSVTLGLGEVSNKQGNSVAPDREGIVPSVVVTAVTVGKTHTALALSPTRVSKRSTPTPVVVATKPAILPRLAPAVPQTNSLPTRVVVPTPTSVVPTPPPPENTPLPVPTPDPAATPTPDPDTAATPDPNMGIPPVPTIDPNIIPGLLP